MTSKPQMLRSSMVVGFFSLLGGLTGILVETSIAAHLGLSKSSDTFYVAYTVPYVITNLLGATGQFSLVPFFSSLETRHSREELWRGFSYAVNLLFLGLGVIAAMGAALAPWLIRGIAPGLTPPQTALATKLAGWLFLVILPAGVVEVFRSFLLSQQRFVLPSASGFIRNVTVILLILFTFNRYGMYSIVMGYFLGYLLQFLALGGQILWSFRPRYSLSLVASGEAFRQLHGAGTAQLLGAAEWQGVVIVERIIASFLPPGTLTALNYGFKIMSTIAELLSGSVGTASLPALSRAVARRNREEESRIYRNTLEISLTLVSPMTVFCLLLHEPIIRLIFQRGNFTPDATALLSGIFFFYSLSLVSFSFIRLLSFALFARGESVMYLRVVTLYFGMTIGFDVLYVVGLGAGAKGIPLALLTSSMVISFLTYVWDISGLRACCDRVLAGFALKTSCASLLTAAVVWGLSTWIGSPQSSRGNFVALTIVCGAGSVVFLGALAGLRAFPISKLAEVWQGPPVS
ncbi:MAG: oligosaccharide flippase family protein [Acidobacteriia bacterium]|nr:oligosaccharide flippase family protein [Terriglobia bacterium]